MTSSAFSLGCLYRRTHFEVTSGALIVGGMRRVTHQHMFCPNCLSWMFTLSESMNEFVNVRATMLSNAFAFRPFIETHTIDMLPWARTPARFSFERLPSPEKLRTILGDYAELFPFP